ncbi:MAG: hypothetical protein ACLGG7_11680 [Bacteriovoracia bacterium]
MTPGELQDWLMLAYGAEKFRPGLERVGTFLAPELAEVKKLDPKIVTVAGTNGKGETSYTLAAMARAAGVPFVLWTSPHIHSVCERFQNLAGAISSDELSELLIEGEKLRQRAGVGLSYYEALWAAFVRWGLEQKASLWILEVGLGGRYDAVNLLDAHVVGLCSISRDHQEFLGPRYDLILGEKLGVVRPNSTLISALELCYLRERARVGNERSRDLFATGALDSSLSFSERNRILASELWLALGYAAQELPQGSLIARGEVLEWQGHRFTFYGSHNPDGVRKLVQFLRLSSYNRQKEFYHQVWAAFSERPQMDLRVMARMLATLGSENTCVRITRFEHLKAAGPAGWWGESEGSHTQYFHDWTELFQLLAPHTDRSVLVVGSYYFVALVQSHLLDRGATRSFLSGTTVSAR